MKFKLFGTVWSLVPVFGMLAMLWSCGTMASPFIFMSKEVSMWWWIPLTANFLILLTVQDKMYTALTVKMRGENEKDIIANCRHRTP